MSTAGIVPAYGRNERWTVIGLMFFVECVAIGALFSSFSTSDKGTYERTYVTGHGKSKKVHVVVNDSGNVHEIEGMRWSYQGRPGTLLLKVPGEFYFREAPPGWDPERYPGWFDLGYTGLLWFSLWIGVMGLGWYLASRAMMKRVNGSAMPGHLVFETATLPFPYFATGILHVSKIAGFDIRPRTVKRREVYDLYARLRDPIDERFLVTRNDMDTAQQLANELEQWRSSQGG